MVDLAVEYGADRIELYTGTYAELFKRDKYLAVRDYIESSNYAIEKGLEINAGHDLDLENLNFLKTSIPNIHEVSIGHALISDSLIFGLEAITSKFSFLACRNASCVVTISCDDSEIKRTSLLLMFSLINAFFFEYS